jgi:hypothetical protein
MRQKHRISPQHPSPDRPTYRFKPSFSAFFSLVAATLTSSVFVVEITNNAKLSTTPIHNIPILIIFVLFVIISSSFLTTSFILKLSGDITIFPAGINGRSSLIRLMYMDWQDISSAKIRYFPGIRYLLIRSTIDKKKSIILDSFTDNLPKILDRVREYAGDNHPLTIALEKEVSLPRQNPARILWRIIIGIVIILSIWLIGGNLYADYREQPLNRAIVNYVRQHPKTAPNQTAIDLQAAMAKLGISLVTFSDGSKATVKPDKLAIEEWKAIYPILDEYVANQLKTTEDSILPPPAKLHTYLDSHQADIAAIQSQLLGSSLPSWGSDSAWVERSDPKAGDSLYTERAYYPHVLQVSRLLIANIFDRYQAPDPEQLQQLKAIENLGRSFQNQSTLIEQLLARISERDINRLFRHFDLTPVGWQENLVNPDSSKMMQAGIEHDLLHNVRIIQDPKILNGYLAAYPENRYKSQFDFLMKYHHLARPYTRSMAVDYYQQSKQNLSFWMTQNICQTSRGGYTRADNFIDTQEIPRQYVKVKTSGLDQELTTSIIQIKSQLRVDKSIDTVANEFKLASQVCPSERWLAKVNDGTITISLSHSPNWTTLGMNEKLNTDRFTYKINPKINKTGF